MSVHGHAAETARGTVVAKAMDGRTTPVEAPFSCRSTDPCIVRLDLPESASGWLLSVRAQDHLAVPESTVPGGVVDLWPVASVEGRVRGPKGGEPIAEIIATFTPSPGRSHPERFPAEGAVPCPVREGRFSCRVPAGILDLRLRAKGHVSVYRWGQRLAPAALVDLGSLELRRGASLVGRVVSPERDAPRPGACTVRLEPPSGGRAPATGSADAPKTGVDSRGFFHLEVVPPGSWILIAEQDGFAPARRAVNVIDGMEANLKEPLVLARPARLDLTLNPPQDPEGKPWMVEVLEAREGSRAETIATAPATMAGAWSRDGLASGRRLMLRVRTSAGHAWWADERSFELTGPVHRRVVEIGVEEIEGTVRLGEHPLAAVLTFGAPEENLSIALRSDTDGRLSGSLPRLGKWRVNVAGQQPSIQRSLEVQVRRTPEGKGELDLILEDKALTGEIVDEKGNPLARAILTVTARGGARREAIQERVEGGQFRLTGFEAGGYLLRAEGSGRMSETVPAEIAEDGSSPFLRIVAEPKKEIAIRLVTEQGAPLAAVRVDMLRTTSFPGLSSISLRTDASGRVAFAVHRGAGMPCFVASQPGWPVRLFSAQQGGEETEIVVPAAGGTIEIPKADRQDGSVLLLWQGSCFLPPALLRSLTKGDENHFPNVAAGEYRLCRHVAGSPAPLACASGFLGAYGSLTLKLDSGS